MSRPSFEELCTEAAAQGICVQETRLPAGLEGVWDPSQKTIWLKKRLPVASMACTLAHELIHLERGDTGHQSDKVERLIEREAARRLIPFENLLEVDWGQPLEKIADDLWVDEATLEVRLATLGGAENELLHARIQASRSA